MSVAATIANPPRRFALFTRLLNDNWSSGSLTVILPHGREFKLTGRAPGIAATLKVNDYRLIDRLFSHGLVGAGESYMAGDWDTPDLSALLLAFSNNLDRLNDMARGNRLVRWAMSVRHWLNANTRAGSKRNIEAHYDLGNDFYGLWLDDSMTYSSARFDTGAVTLAEAQAAKYAALARLIDLRPGEHVLEIGCGWGGFAEYAAGRIGARVTGVTLSPAQLDFARRRIARAGLADKVDLQLVDYRDVRGQFDKIASIEMFEAVGEAYWPSYFRQVHDLLKPGGLAGLQIITIREDLFETYRKRADFIQRYIFPGGMLPSAPRLESEIAAAGLALRAKELFSEDYGRTLRAWRDRFEAAKAGVEALGFDERFCRMWSFYLAYCEAGFRTRRTEVGQWVAARA